MIDVGDELASVVPIYDGFVLRKGAASSAGPLYACDDLC